jgi:hypothetical protein
MKGEPLGEAESAQNTKIARHEETRRQVYGQPGGQWLFYGQFLFM